MPRWMWWVGFGFRKIVTSIQLCFCLHLEIQSRIGEESSYMRMLFVSTELVLEYIVWKWQAVKILLRTILSLHVVHGRLS